MLTFFPRRTPETLSLCIAMLLCLIAWNPAATAQVLARPGWAGSGVTVETWWRRAVFYRLDPATFQDSNGDGRGDLAGVTQRLDYLQSLSVDAIILSPAAGSPGLSPKDDAGFDDLSRAASLCHIRVLIALDDAGLAPSANTLLAAARSWLTQGAAGFFLNANLLSNSQFTPAMLHQLHLLVASFPGERILLSAAAPRENSALAGALSHEVQLIAAAPLASSDATALRNEVQNDLNAAPSNGKGALPLLLAARRLPVPDATARTLLESDLALLLLGSRSAVLLDYGQELGLDSAAGSVAPLMQWTPGNRTLPPPPPPEMPKTFDTTVYKPFVPYVPPIAKSANPKPPPLPTAYVSETPDPRTLPGFSAAAPDEALIAPNGAAANVATEAADPFSLLNFYRHLSQLHHQDASVLDGAQLFLDHDAEGAVVWLRRPTPGARTSGTVLAVCNLTNHNLHLALNKELRAQRAPYGELRTLAADTRLPLEDSADIVLPPGGAYLGEFAH